MTLHNLLGNFWGNPVVVKDVRTRMRGYRAFILVTAHLVVLLLAVGIAYLVFRSALTSTGNLEERRLFGKSVFGLLVWIELVMVSFVAPGVTSGSISSERERQTFDLLRVTLLPAYQMVLGKYLPGLFFVFLLLFTSIPLQGPAFLIGGVLWQEILLATLILAVTAVAFCALGLLLSSLIRRTLIATTLAYASTIFLVFGIPIICLILLVLFSSAISNRFDQLSGQTEGFLLILGWILVSLTPLGVMIGTEAILLDQQSLVLASIPLSDGKTVVLLSPWIPYVLFYLAFSLAALWLSILLVRQLDN
jgi:ABC-type transport system involved in multi-copper enzyme maturation permease subunit